MIFHTTALHILGTDRNTEHFKGTVSQDFQPLFWDYKILPGLNMNRLKLFYKQVVNIYLEMEFSLRSFANFKILLLGIYKRT